MKFGVDYYPEHWPRERWERDAELMVAMGIDVVRMAEFAWARLEPRPDVYEFEWLDDAIAVMQNAGIKVVLGTPTAATPTWIAQNDPDTRPVDSHGVRMSFGGRHHVCHSNKRYRERSAAIVTAMAEHYAGRPNVVAWQIDNELGNSHNPLCYCDSCRAAFHVWLEKRYGTIDALNAAWGTEFWSQTYAGFDQIPTPRVTPNSHNPSVLLAWRRFCSDLIITFMNDQCAIIREHDANVPITHNLMGFFDKVDYTRMADGLDFVSHDQYPVGFWTEGSHLQPAHRLAMPLDFMYGLKDKPFWIMEQQSGPAGWETIGATPRPGQLKLWAAQSVAHGADCVVFFRWRTCLVGTEQYWHGILPHDGEPGRRYDELKKTVAALKPVMERCVGVGAEAEVAMVFSYDDLWAHQIQPHHPEYNYTGVFSRFYRALHSRGVPVAIVGPAADLSRYAAVVIPSPFTIDEAFAARLHGYVEAGGRLVVTTRAGIKNRENAVIPVTPPAFIDRLLGVRVSDYDCLRAGAVAVSRNGEAIGSGEFWADVIDEGTAETRARFAGEYYTGKPAATRNAHGNGAAYYIATIPDDGFAAQIVDDLCRDAETHPVLTPPDGVEVTRRRSESEDIVFLLNHADAARSVPVPAEWDVILGDSAAGVVKLPAFGVAVCRAAR